MISIDVRNRKPLYQQLVDNIEDLAARGLLPPDSQLPSVRNLAMELSINPNTIQRAYNELERRGVTYGVPGRGSFISQATDQLLAAKRQEMLRRLAALVAEARALGLTEEQLLAACRAAFAQAVGTLSAEAASEYRVNQPSAAGPKQAEGSDE